MLVIRRKSGESILIGDNIEVQITDLSPSRVKLGITAPPTVLILRKEVFLASEQNRAAAHGLSPEAIHSVVSRFRSHTRA